MPSSEFGTFLKKPVGRPGHWTYNEDEEQNLIITWVYHDASTVRLEERGNTGAGNRHDRDGQPGYPAQGLPSAS